MACDPRLLEEAVKNVSGVQFTHGSNNRPPDLIEGFCMVKSRRRERLINGLDAEEKRAFVAASGREGILK